MKLFGMLQSTSQINPKEIIAMKTFDMQTPLRTEDKLFSNAVRRESSSEFSNKISNTYLGKQIQ